MHHFRPIRNLDPLEPSLTIFLGQWPMVVIVRIRENSLFQIAHSKYENLPWNHHCSCVLENYQHKLRSRKANLIKSRKFFPFLFDKLLSVCRYDFKNNSKFLIQNFNCNLNFKLKGQFFGIDSLMNFIEPFQVSLTTHGTLVRRARPSHGWILALKVRFVFQN